MRGPAVGENSVESEPSTLNKGRLLVTARSRPFLSTTSLSHTTYLNVPTSRDSL